MKSLIDKVGVRNLVAAVIVGLGVAGVVLVATGQFSDDKRPSSAAQTARPRATPTASTRSPHSFPDAPADEASRGTAQYGGQRSYGDSYNPYYGSEDDDDAAEAYYGYYGYPYEEEDDGETYVPPPTEEDDGGYGTAGEPGQPGYPYGDGDGGGGAGGEGGPGGAGG